MPRKVLDVFLSSTARDLAAYRDAVHERLTRTPFFHCIRQEDFGAQDAGAVEFCRAQAQAADLFVGLIGLRRGWEPDGDNATRSITEMEYDWAKQAGRRRFLWVTADDFPVPGNLRESDAQHARQQAFRGRLMAGGERIVSQKGFTQPDTLASEIVVHLLTVLVTGDLISQIGMPRAVDALDRGQAVAEAVEAAARGAEKGDPQLARALDLLQEGKTAEAEPLFRAVAEEREEASKAAGREAAEAWRHLGAIAALADPRRSREAYARAAALDPDNVEGLFWHGWLQQEAGNLSVAETAYARLLASGKQPGRWHCWAWFGLGDVAAARGGLSKAKSSYLQAQAITDRLAKSDPDNALWQRDLSVSFNRVGNVQLAQGDLPGALKSYSDGLAIVDRLAKSDPGDTNWQRDLSVSFTKVGDVQLTRGDLAGALKCYNDSLAIVDRLTKSDPDNALWQVDLAATLHRTGEVQEAQGDLASARKSNNDCLAIVDRLAKSDPSNAGWQRHLASALDRVGDVQKAQDDLAGALKSYNDGLAIKDRLAKVDPYNASWQGDLSVSYSKLARAYRKGGKTGEALDALRQGRAIISRLTAMSPENATWKKDLAWFEGQIAELSPGDQR
jgi:tetratricopeptide (TPR) repeat protein